MSWMLMNAVAKDPDLLENRDLRSPDRHVLLMLAFRHNHTTKICNPSHKRIAKDTGLGVSTVKRALHVLRQAGFITWKAQQKTGSNENERNQYSIPYTFDPEDPSRTFALVPSPIREVKKPRRSKVRSARTRGRSNLAPLTVAHSDPTLGPERADPQSTVTYPLSPERAQGGSTVDQKQGTNMEDKQISKQGKEQGRGSRPSHDPATHDEVIANQGGSPEMDAARAAKETKKVGGSPGVGSLSARQYSVLSEPRKLAWLFHVKAGELPSSAPESVLAAWERQFANLLKTGYKFPVIESAITFALVEDTRWWSQRLAREIDPVSCFISNIDELARKGVAMKHAEEKEAEKNRPIKHGLVSRSIDETLRIAAEAKAEKLKNIKPPTEEELAAKQAAAEELEQARERLRKNEIIWQAEREERSRKWAK